MFNVKAGCGALSAAMALVASVSLASAHVTAYPNEAIAGGYFQTAFNVTHGCEGSPTVALSIKLPEGVVSVKPQMKAGWTIEITKRKLATPVQMHGKTIDETVDRVTWRGGPVPDNLFDTFGLMMKLPDTPGKSLYFPVTQTCEKGETQWTDIPAAQNAKETRTPAPAIRLKARASDTGGHAH